MKCWIVFRNGAIVKIFDSEIKAKELTDSFTKNSDNIYEYFEFDIE